MDAVLLVHGNWEDAEAGEDPRPNSLVARKDEY